MVDSSKNPSQYTVIMNHMISNEFELYAYPILYALILLLYVYQCYKIGIYYSNRTDDNKVYLQFEILFGCATLLRIIQMEYSLIGYAIDSKNDLLIDENHILFCDPLLKFHTKFYCYSNYKVYAIFSSLSFLIFNIIVQCISMFWIKRGFSILSIFITSNEFKKGIEYFIFAIINIAQLILYILAFFLQYYDTIMIVIKIYEYLACLVTFIYFIYSLIKYHRVNRQEKEHLIISVGILLCIFTKFVYITYRFIQKGDKSIEEYYQKSIEMSNLIYSMVFIDQLIFRLLVVKLF